MNDTLLRILWLRAKGSVTQPTPEDEARMEQLLRQWPPAMRARQEQLAKEQQAREQQAASEQQAKVTK